MSAGNVMQLNYSFSTHNETVPEKPLSAISRRLFESNGKSSVGLSDFESHQTSKSESPPKTHMRNEMSSGNVTQLKYSFSTHNDTVSEMPQVQYNVDFLNQTVQAVSTSFLHKTAPFENFLINLTSTSTRDINVIPDKDFKWWAKPENIISSPTFPSTAKLDDYGPWKFEFVTVEVINSKEIPRYKGNDINVVYDEPLEELYKLRLTPTVVVKWVYKLARAIAEGILKLRYIVIRSIFSDYLIRAMCH